MKKLKLPRLVQWIALNGVIFLLLMSLFRLILVLAFKTTSAKSVSLIPSFLLGFRYDARMVGIAAMIIFLIGSIPFLHPFNKKWGRITALWLWGIVITVLCVFYAIDFTHYAYLQQRLNSSVLNYLDDAKISMKVVWETYNITWILLGLLVVIALLVTMVKGIYFLFRFIQQHNHKQANRCTNTEINKDRIKTSCFIQQKTCQHRGNKSAEISAAIDN